MIERHLLDIILSWSRIASCYYYCVGSWSLVGSSIVVLYCRVRCYYVDTWFTSRIYVLVPYSGLSYYYYVSGWSLVDRINSFRCETRCFTSKTTCEIYRSDMSFARGEEICLLFAKGRGLFSFTAPMEGRT